MENVFDKESLEGDENFDLIDGWEDLPEVHQETVRKALTEGHVPDEDWKGVSAPHLLDSTKQANPASSISFFFDTDLLTDSHRTLNATDRVCEGSAFPRRRLLLRKRYVISFTIHLLTDC